MESGRTHARRALVVDDERPIADVVRAYLERDGFEVEVASDGPGALAVARTLDPDLVVLDLGLPGSDGVEVCRRLRTFSDCYVVMLTARAEEGDRVTGLSVGADDYMTKPFSPRELVARVGAMFRRPRAGRGTAADDGSDGAGGHGIGGPPRPPLVVGDLEIDLDAREVRRGQDTVDLTRTEFDVLSALAARPHAALSRAELIATVWGENWVGDEHLVDVHVLHVRQKLRDSASEQRYVRTVRGVGYRIGPGR